MKLLLQYLSRHKWLIVLALFFAAVNQVFSLLDPYIFGNYIIDKYAKQADNYNKSEFINGIMTGLLLLVGTAMVSRIAKAFQDYTVNVVIQKFGTRLYTDGLQHALRLPYHDFEDQRSGETLSILQKVRADSEKFISAFVNVLFATFVGIVFVIVYALTLSAGPWLVLIYMGGAILLSLLMNLLSKKIKVIQKSILGETNALAGSTTESLRNIELVKSLGLTQQEVNRLNDTTIKILGLELKKVRSLRSISFVQGTFVNFLRQCIMFCLLYFLFQDKLTLGQMFTMQFYSFFIFAPLQEIGNIILAYREAQASLGNMRDLFNRKIEEKPVSPEQLGSVQTMRFEDVSFQHNTATKPALEGISFEVKKGETVAFVGPSGFDKTTLRLDLPDWNAKGTTTPKEKILITQSLKELQQIMSDYVGIVRNDIRLGRAMKRLDLLHEETEHLYRTSNISPMLCELRNLITVGYLIVKSAQFRKESRGLHYNVDYPEKSDILQDIVL